MFEIWRAGGSNTTTSAEVARAVEAEGWGGQWHLLARAVLPALRKVLAGQRQREAEPA